MSDGSPEGEFGAISDIAQQIIICCKDRKPYEIIAACEMVTAWARTSDAKLRDAMSCMASNAFASVIPSNETPRFGDLPGMHKPNGSAVQDKWVAEILKE